MRIGSLGRSSALRAPHKCEDKRILGCCRRLLLGASRRRDTPSAEIRAERAVSSASTCEEEAVHPPASLWESLASPEMSAESGTPKLVPVKLEAGKLSAEGGFSVLEGVASQVRARKVDGLESAVLLGVSSSNSASRLDFKLGDLVCSRFLACARIKLWWMTPEWGSKASQLPPETQFLLLQSGRGGPFTVILPLIDSGRFRCTLRPPRKQEDAETALRLRIESGDDAVLSQSWDSAVLVAAGYDPFHLVDLAVAAGARLSGGAKARVDKVVPEFVNHFGWCTWDAFYSTVSAEGLQQGLQSLKDGNVPPKFLIIDDGWQQTGADQPKAKESNARLEAKKEMLKSVGAGGSYPVNKLQQEEGGPSPSWLTTLADKAIGRFQALAETALFAFYKGFIESAPQGSWQIALFTYLTKGPLKSFLLDYYALTSDHTQRLRGVKANGKFSGTGATPDTLMTKEEDLKSIVEDARDRFGVKYVYAWHSLHGYWAGIQTGSSPAMPYNARLVMPAPTPGVLEIDPCFGWSQQVVAGVGVAEDVEKLYSDMHTYLAGAGIDGVKVDCQAILGMVGGGSPGLGGGPALSAEYHRALEASVARHFPGNNCINCMCHSTDDIYRMECTTIARSSDDFWPRDPASHTTHVAVNAYNSLFMGAILQPDWDMFHSRHPAALLHATARVLSGGPLYVSDKPGQHDIDLLKRLVLSDGTLLRCVQVGRPTLDCLFDDVMRDGSSLLKVWNMNLCSGVVGSFNLQGASWSRRMRRYQTHDESPAPLSTTVSPSDLPSFKELPSSTRFAVYSDAAKKLWQLASWEGVQSLLQPGCSDLFTLVPTSHGRLQFAPIGLTNMLNSGGAISEWDALSSEGDAAFSFKVKGRGELLAYSSQKPSRVLVNGESVKFGYSQADGALTCSIASEASSIRVQP